MLSDADERRLNPPCPRIHPSQRPPSPSIPEPIHTHGCKSRDCNTSQSSRLVYKMDAMTSGSCIVAGCAAVPSKDGFDFCYPHWKAHQKGKLHQCGRCNAWHEGDLCPACDENPSEELGPAELTSTKLGQRLSLSAQRTNLVLAELGWIEKYVKGWTPTDAGNRLGAELRTSSKGVPYVVWPESILTHNALLASLGSGDPDPDPPVSDVAPAAASSRPAADEPSDSPIGDTDAFRRRYPAAYRTQDGHLVRSRAEVMIDDYLYINRIVHAYERRLPIEQDVLCDFYLPEKKVYIEFWGLESDPRYQERMRAKQAIYAEHGFNLIELHDADVQSLDDTLPRKLLAFGIDCA